MANASDILTYIKIVFFAFIIFAILIYSIPIIIIPRFRIRYNILTLNLCLATMSCALYWLVFLIVLQIDTKMLFRDSTCSFLLYMQMMCISQASYSIVLVSINQLCDIVFHTKRFFKTNKWLMICIASQWIIASIVAIPAYARIRWFCASPGWLSYYEACVNIVIPAIVCVIIHIIIFNHIRLSTRRVHAQSQISQTTTNSIQQPKFTRRDLHLLRHMMFIFGLFIVGWGFIHFVSIINAHVKVHELITSCASLLSEVTALAIIIDLYIYNKELREYLRRKLFPCF